LVDLFGIATILNSKPMIVNNLIDNAAQAIIDRSAGQDSTVIMNNILWNVRMHFFSITLQTKYKFENNLIDFYGNSERDVHESNIFLIDPLFIDEENGDYRLRDDSPVKDKGSTRIDGYQFPEKDYYGNERISGSNVDIGVSEIIN